MSVAPERKELLRHEVLGSERQEENTPESFISAKSWEALDFMPRSLVCFCFCFMVGGEGPLKGN